jgi:hypothetical protein
MGTRIPVRPSFRVGIFFADSAAHAGVESTPTETAPRN